jgi:CRP-like cAMP-binding protein
VIPPEFLRNRVLTESPAGDQEAVLAGSQWLVLRAGQTFASPGDPVQSVFFPVSGVVTYVSEMTTGHEVSVAAVGREGLVASTAVADDRHPYRIVALIDSQGYQVRIDSLRRAFNELEGFRTAVVADMSQQWRETTSLVACGRVHSHRQRVARWLLMTVDKSRESSLVLTHDDLARMVGATRHAVTTVLNALRREGAIVHVRGRIDVVDHAVLVREACECYRHSAELTETLEVR